MTVPRAALRRFAHVPLLAPALVATGAIFWVSMGVMLLLSVYPFLAAEGPRFNLDAWRKFFTDPYYWDVVLTTLRMAFLVTFFALLLGYPTAYAMHRLRSPRVLIAVYVVLFAPILVSVVVRTYGWLILLSKEGVVNFVLRGLGVIVQPLPLLFNMTGIVIAMVHILLPFMTFPILSVITQLTPDLKEASMDLGANRWQTFWRVTVPLTLPGVIAGCQIVFTLTLRAFVTPFLMGGGKIQVLSLVIYRDMEALSFAFAAVVSFVLLGLALIILVISNRLAARSYARAEVLRV